MGGVVRTFDKLFGLGGYTKAFKEPEPMQMDAPVVGNDFAGIAKKQKKGNYGSVLSGGTQSAAPVETKSLLGG